jgi:hypothetical protein
MYTPADFSWWHSSAESATQPPLATRKSKYSIFRDWPVTIGQLLVATLAAAQYKKELVF